jgi:predicted nuclease of predicted toxin-antitoxin system
VKILTDENVPPSIIEMLRQLGHDVLDIKESGQIGLPDQAVFEMAKETDRLLVTLNRHDFEDQERFPATACAGIIVSHIRPNVAELVSPRLRALLISTKPEKLHGKLTILYRRGWRIGARGRSSRRK